MFTLYHADVTGNSGNCSYPHKVEVTDAASLQAAVCHDYVCAEYRNNYRNGENFIGSDCLPVDCDNDHSEDPADWITPEDVTAAFPGVTFAVHYSRFNMREKNGKAARPKFHVLFPIEFMFDPVAYADMKKLVNSIFPYFDTQALDAARFFFGTNDPKVELHTGDMTLTEFLEGDDEFDADMGNQKHGDRSIPEGSRNATMSRFAGRVIKKYGDSEEAYNCFMEEAAKCTPPLEQSELMTIWHSAQKFYARLSQQNLIIDPEQAEVVKRIYREYLDGYSMDKIAAGLEADGILTGAGKTKWHTSTINKILRNEKYIGDALLQKTYTTDFLNKTRVKNNGIVPQYYVEGSHEAIIPREVFLKVQEELVRRRVVNTSANGKKRSYSCNHCFSQIIICGDCGEMFRRIHWNNHGCKSIVWRCISRLEPTGLECHARTVNEQELEAAVVKALNELLTHREGYQNQLAKNIATVIRASATASTDAIDEKLLTLQQDLLKKANNKEAYDEIADEIFRLRELKQQAAVDTVTRDEQIGRITELQDFIRSQPADLTEFDEVMVKRWVQKITVWPDRYTVELKSGLSVDN